MSGIALHYTCSGPFSYNLGLKVFGQIKETFNFDKLLDQIRNNQEEQQTLNLIKAARIVSKLQSKFKEEFIEKSSFIDVDKMTQIVDQVKAKVEKLVEQQRYVQALYWLASVSDYPNACFNFDKDEPKINRLVKDCFKGVSIRGAYPPFINIMAAETTQATKKLALKLMREFANNYSD